MNMLHTFEMPFLCIRKVAYIPVKAHSKVNLVQEHTGYHAVTVRHQPGFGLAICRGHSGALKW